MKTIGEMMNKMEMKLKADFYYKMSLVFAIISLIGIGTLIKIINFGF